jgi:hypothetical protein
MINHCTKRITILVAGFALLSTNAMAKGGPCPTGSHYLDPTGKQVTLSSLGITSCYYVSASGSDANDGTTQATAWLHAPQMPSCSGQCATVQNQSNGIPPGTGIILRGGDTWHMGNSSATPYTGGVWNFNSGQSPMGTSSNPIYVGVDPTWYIGASWARPVLTGDNPANKSPVGSCPYQIGTQNSFIELSALQYYIVDNLEMTGLCQQDTAQPFHHDVYVSYGSLRGPVTFQNLYIHGWTHLPFAYSNGDGRCVSDPAVCFNIFAFNGSGGGGVTPGETIQSSVVDGADSDAIGAGLCFGGFYNVFNSVFRYTSQCITSTQHLFHDNLYEYFVENGHSNLLESVSEFQGTNAIYNNIFRHIQNTCVSGCGVAFWPMPSVGQTDYFFNNVASDVGPLEFFNVGQNGGVAQGSLVLLSNTWQLNGPGSGLDCSTQVGSAPISTVNMHVISADAAAFSSSCQFVANSTNLYKTNAQATAGGYTSTETYQFSPPAKNAYTVGAGTDGQSYCTTLKASSDPLVQAAGSACQSDTTSACTYDSATHSVSCPARTVVARSSNAAWDVGAYQFDSCTSNADCTAKDDCHVDGTCDTATGACTRPTKPDGAACPAGSCSSGVCVPNPDGGAADASGAPPVAPSGLTATVR